VEIGSKNENVRNSFILLESAVRSVVALIINDMLNRCMKLVSTGFCTVYSD